MIMIDNNDFVGPRYPDHVTASNVVIGFQKVLVLVMPFRNFEIRTFSESDTEFVSVHV